MIATRDGQSTRFFEHPLNGIPGLITGGVRFRSSSRSSISAFRTRLEMTSSRMQVAVRVTVVVAALQLSAALLGLYQEPRLLSCTNAIASMILGLKLPQPIASGEESWGDSIATPYVKPPEQRHLTSLGQPHYQFVRYSAYRESSTSFLVIGLSSRITRAYDKPVYDCVWRPGDVLHSGSNITTAAKLHFDKGDENGRPYGVLVVRCEFRQQVGADALGGGLYLSVSSGPPVGAVQEALVLQEVANSSFSGNASGSFPFKYSFCSAPIQGNVSHELIRQWLTYHLYLMEGKAHFFFHSVGGLTEEGLKLLEPFISGGFLTITNVTDDILYPTWYHAQVLVINDCLHRSRFLANWAFFFDFDEFIYLQPPLTLAAIFENLPGNATGVTFGSWPVGTSHCRPAKNPEEWPIQRMVFKKQPGPECRKPKEYSAWLCPKSLGRRKMALDPRKVTVSGIHLPVSPANAEVHLNASVVRIDHFRGVVSQALHLCAATWNVSSFPDQHRNPKYSKLYVVPDETLSEAIAQARASVPQLYLKSSMPNHG